MKRIAFVLSFSFLIFSMSVLWVQAQSIGAHAEGTVTQEGKPLPNVQVVFTYVDNGKTFKTKTDKNGHFVLVGAPYGSYQLDVLSETGEKLFSQQTSLGHEDTSNPDELKIDIPKGGAATDNKFGLTDAPAPKLTKEQLAKIKSDNKKIAGLNSLIAEAQNARQAQDWPKAENALKQLIAAAPDTNRWDFYQALGEAQSKSNKPAEAVQTYDKGIQVAQSLISGSAPADPKIPSLNPAAARQGAGRMLTSQGNDYMKLQKPDEAIAALKKATEVDPSSALYSYNLCGVEFNAQKFADAKTACNKYLQLEPSGPHAEEVKAFLAEMPAK
ncbi:MAG TPA: tetratricopeptide repeat protein [Candidatus Angelobacter sp.]|jgi:tetratricopeptide (TPR) repeat protein|nr:tetratricopeptide repeat protein [Candidatus Angelobacter sp.]